LENLPINPGDLAVVVILLLSALLAFARGFVQEVLSIAGWVGAAAVTWFGLEPGAAFVQEQFAFGDLVSRLVAGGVIFVVALIVFSVATHYIAKGVRGSALNAVDRSLGFVFGLARGALLVVLAYMLLVWVTPDDRPQWVAEARSLPLVERGADWLRGMVPGDALDGTIERAERLRDDAQTAAEGATSLQRLQQPRPAEAEGADQGYAEEDRQGLENLVGDQAEPQQ
jgi:membrane protein required for colicin V production